MTATSTFTYDLARFLPFRDLDACERARAIPRSELTRHSNPDFRIATIDNHREFYRSFAEDLVGRIRLAREEGRQFVAILPVGPMPQYAIAAELINAEGLSLEHVHTFNMDEYANEDGETAPAGWPGVVSACDARALLWAAGRAPTPAGVPNPLPDHRRDRRLQRPS